MYKQLRMAAGYLSILLMPILLVLGVWARHPYLAFGTAMLVFPLARGIFGGYRHAEPIVWNERVATFLDRLPIAYGFALLIAMLLVLALVAGGAANSPAPAFGIGLSLWMTMLFATCPAHELVHRRNALDLGVGWFVAGLAGYPLLGHEHLIHHARFGDTRRAEWPRLDESVWRFGTRRIGRIVQDAIGSVGSSWSASGSVSGHRLQRSAIVTLAMWVAFSLAGGPIGFLIYLGVIIGVAFGVQIITYLQHWGLGDDSIANAGTQQLAWEDDCLFQAWVTLHISFHQSHHQWSRLPYYRVPMTSNSPRQPAGYVLLMLLCMFPGLWRKLMQPVLEHWKHQPDFAQSPGRHLTCFALYSRRAPGA